MIKSVKYSLKPTSLTLMIQKVGIETALRIMKILEEETDLSKRLYVQFIDVERCLNPDNFIESLS